MASIGKSVRGCILTGILLLLPFITTIWVFFKIFALLDSAIPSFVGALDPALGTHWVPGVGLLLFLLIAYLTGLAAKNYFGHQFIQLGNRLISRIPLVNKIYVGVQQILDAVVSQNKTLFQKVVLVEFPKHGCYSIGFLTSKTTGQIPHIIDKKMLNIFVPSTPPTAGFLIFVPESEVVELDMTVEAAFKVIMSAGVLNPDQVKKMQRLYKIPESPKAWNWLTTLKRRRSPDEIRDPRD